MYTSKGITSCHVYCEGETLHNHTRGNDCKKFGSSCGINSVHVPHHLLDMTPVLTPKCTESTAEQRNFESSDTINSVKVPVLECQHAVLFQISSRCGKIEDVKK